MLSCFYDIFGWNVAGALPRPDRRSSLPKCQLTVPTVQLCYSLSFPLFPYSSQHTHTHRFMDRDGDIYMVYGICIYGETDVKIRNMWGIWKVRCLADCLTELASELHGQGCLKRVNQLSPSPRVLLLPWA